MNVLSSNLVIVNYFVHFLFLSIYYIYCMHSSCMRPFVEINIFIILLVLLEVQFYVMNLITDLTNFGE
jgi:hypothetical protein